MKFKLGDFEDSQVRALLTRHLENMHNNSPAGAAFALDVSALQSPEITFLTVWEDGILLGCGALKELDPESGELKSMRTADAHLRKGVGRAMLSELIRLARERGYRRLSLETGSSAPFAAAVAFYERNGFQRGEAFANYAASEFNQFFHLELPSNWLQIETIVKVVGRASN